MIYDLIVVGNGLAAQTFLFELFNDVKKSQNFSVAQIFSEDIAPACSLRTTATVSSSGIEEGISELGDELSRSFYLFEEFVKKNSPDGIEQVEQFITYSSEKEKEKLERRYKKLDELSSPHFKENFYGKKLNSYLISPEDYSLWFDRHIEMKKINRRKAFVSSVTKTPENLIEVTLLGGEKILTQKIIFCTGAYAKILSHFFPTTEVLDKTQSVAGSFLERLCDLDCSSFYLTMDGHNLLYRSPEKKLILGSASKKGAFQTADFPVLLEVLKTFQEKLSFPLGDLSDYKIKTGLRHKGMKRRPFYGALDADKSIYLISGLYKNGFTFSHLTASELLKLPYSLHASGAV